MPSRKRAIGAVDGERDTADLQPLHRIRNMWQFANLCQWIYIFGKTAKIDESLDIERIETEFLKPSSDTLLDIALALLKLVSSHRGLTHEILDDHVRKQYLTRLPDHNPFGDGESLVKFVDFDIYTKIRVLQQLTQWIMIHPERIRDKMEEQRDIDQTGWRIEPYGWDSDDRTYYVLDDNRVYRLTEAPEPPPKPGKGKSSRASRRSSKRRRTTLFSDDDHADVADKGAENIQSVDDGLGGMTWECVAITLDDVRRLLDMLRKSRDENEKILRRQLEDHLVPILEKQEESRKRKELQRERELLNLAKMANAKRSSRLAGKAEQKKKEHEDKEEERHLKEAESAKQREERLRLEVERERDTRLASREKRLQEREARRIQHEEELANLSEDSKQVESGKGRLSERRLQAEIERNRQALMDLEQEEDDWVFDCICGMHGHVDDGTHSVACERCNVWYHSKCLGISEEEADRPEFQFICKACIQQEEDSKGRPRPTTKLKLGHPSGKISSANDVSVNGPAPNPSLVVQLPARVASPASPPFLNSSTQGLGNAQVVDQALQAVLSPPNGSERPLFPPAAKDVLDGQSAPSGTALGGTTVLESAHRAHNTTHHPANLDSTGKAGGQLVPGSGVARPDQSVSPTSVLSSTPNAMKQLHASNGIETTLITPHISRDIYRAAHLQNGVLPSEAGYSPTKHSPQQSDAERNKASGPGLVMPPAALLSPTPRETIMTPPTKPSETLRPNGTH